ncbi:MAG: transglutaminase domain-containing protein [Thermoanaerobaculia bacterium]
MRKRWSWLATSGLIGLIGLILLGGGGTAHAATILERAVQVEIRPDGSVIERERLRVRLDSEGDLALFSPHSIYLDENSEIESLSAAVIRPDGKVENVPRKALDTHEVVGYGELHSSMKVRSVSFPQAPVGSVLSLDSEVKVRPWFPAGSVPLVDSSSPIESLRVEVKGGGSGWRWRLDGSLPGLQVKETPGGVEITGRSLPRLSPPDLAPASASAGAILRYAWGDTAGWEKVGTWYERLTAEVPRGTEPVRAKARELTAGLSGRREKLEALLAFARKQVRYVAVEVGIGGYRPHTPNEVLERRWGDCKDKAFLLIDLLREAGIEAWPVLVLSSGNGRVDREFPSPQFNHAIVAVSAEGLGLTEADPVAGGYLFVDPTQPLGALSWLHPATQDQEALVVRGGRGELVRTPIRQQSEERKLSVDVTLSPSGEATGEARLELLGMAGWAYLDLLQTRRPEEIERVVLESLGGLLPGVKLEQPKLAAHDSGVPAATLTAKLHLVLPEAYQPGSVPQFPVPAFLDMPAPGVLDNRELPVVADPFSTQMTWSVTLPQDGCPPASGQELTVENDLGSFRQSFKLDGRKLTLERRSELRRRWIEPAAFPALKEISLAEHRASKRRLRVECSPHP